MDDCQQPTSRALDLLHPITKAWFTSKFGEPTAPQEAGWQEIAGGKGTLIAAPTGSGKTLAGFLYFIDSLIQQAQKAVLPPEVRLVYVSPLKALSNDIERNLQRPLAELDDLLEEHGYKRANIGVQVRTGDTPASERAKMVRNPPQILVTTPESLYLILTSRKASAMLQTTAAVIVDEIHALVRDKRGSHFALTLARLDHLVKTVAGNSKPQRIGLSATQKPIAHICAFLHGSEAAAEKSAIIDGGHHRDMLLRIRTPKLPLSAVCSHEQWEEIYQQMVELIESHRSTVVFVNTRRLAERVAFRLSEYLGEDAVASHHGSLSKARRLAAERALKAGKLKAIVATASLELGIDIGHLDLMIQVSSPRNIAVFLQRVGRSGHAVGLKPHGEVFALTRDDLVETTALLGGVKNKELDRIIIPESPMDILSQQLVAILADEAWREDDLFALVRQAYPYRNLERTSFDGLLDAMASGFSATRRDKAFITRDRINGLARAKRGANLAAITSGGAIPELGEYRVVLESEQTFIGTVNEDFAVESSAGDIFLLGSNSWQIIQVKSGQVIVRDAHGAPPTIPFWEGEAPGRSKELSVLVSDLRREIAARLPENFQTPTEVPDTHGMFQTPTNVPDTHGMFQTPTEVPDTHGMFQTPTEVPDTHGMFQTPTDYGAAVPWLRDEFQLDTSAAIQLAHYIASEVAALGRVPSHQDIIFERFFDEAGGTQLVIHSPYGMQINRAWGLALRKRFCRSFNFELQAVADDNGIILSLGPQHSFEIASLFKMINPANARHILIQALLDAPMFQVRWRWNTTRALAILRFSGGNKVPPPLQRFRADDLLSQAFPMATACLENVVGDIEVPDHPLVKQTVDDCLTEAMNIDGLEELLQNFASGAITFSAVDTREPSPFCYGLLNANPYAFLDDAELQDRRTRAVPTRRSLPLDDLTQLAKFDPEAIAVATSQAWPLLRDAEDIHAALTTLVACPKADLGPDVADDLDELTAAGRISFFDNDGTTLVFAAENLAHIQALWPSATPKPAVVLPPQLTKNTTAEEATHALVLGWLESSGPMTTADLASKFKLPANAIEAAVTAIESAGAAVRGQFHEERAGEFCHRRQVIRMHRLTLESLRQSIRPVAATTFMHYLAKSHGLLEPLTAIGDDTGGIRRAVALVEGFSLDGGALEAEILAPRVADYDKHALDRLAYQGELFWGCPPRPEAGGLSKATSVTLIFRPNLGAVIGGTDDRPRLSSSADKVLQLLLNHGASFTAELVTRSGMLPSKVDEALAELVAKGMVASDGFAGLRRLLAKPSDKTQTQASRWCLFPPDFGEAKPSEDRRQETWVEILLHRYKVLFRDIISRESSAPRWGELLRVLRLWEARGKVRGGRFVEGMAGEQFASEETVTQLRQLARRSNEADEPEWTVISAHDPLNLVGWITAESKVPAQGKNKLAILNGKVAATLIAGEIAFHQELDQKLQNDLSRFLRLIGSVRRATRNTDR